MAGGTWTRQDKVLPGFYINIKSAPNSDRNYGERGVVGLCEPLSWGPVGEVTAIDAYTDVYHTLGYDLDTAPGLLFLRELFLGSTNADGGARTAGASKVLLYRPEGTGAARASATIGTGEGALTVTARYPGVRGNSITVAASADPDAASGCTVITYVDGKREDEQFVTDWGQLAGNAWVSFSGAGAPSAAAVTPLTGGADGNVDSAAYASFLEAVEPYPVNVLVYAGTDLTVQKALISFVKRMREQEGRKMQVVMPGCPQADYEGVISPCNAPVLKSGALTAAQACWWVGGCTAGARYNQSLTYAGHPGAVDVAPRYSNAQARELILAGNLVFTEEEGKVRVFYDINTLTTFTADKGEVFSKNRPVRVLDTIANDLYRIFSDYHIGRTDNNTEGRALVKKEVVGMLNTMQANGGVQNFTAEDVTVEAGEAADTVVITLAVQPMDAVAKIYMTVMVS